MELYQQIGMPPGVYDRPWREVRMPNYDYRCPNGHTLEVHVPLTELDITTVLCAACGEAMSKQPAAPGFVVKGFNVKNGYS